MSKLLRIAIVLPPGGEAQRALQTSWAIYGNVVVSGERLEADLPEPVARYLLRYRGATLVSDEAASHAFGGDIFEDPRPGGFHSYGSLSADIQGLVQAARGIVLTECLGRTHEGRDIVALRIPPLEPTRKRILLIGGHHARERIAVEIPWLIGAHVVSAQMTGAPIAALRGVELMIIPMLNPDGHAWLAQDEYRWSWRKNRSLQVGGIGVDLNRNYPWRFGCGDGDDVAISPYYRGRSALSELETQAMKRLFDRLTIDALISYHSFGQHILYPWASEHYAGGDARIDALIAVATEMACASRAVGADYDAIPASRVTGDIVGGEIGDWAIRAYGINALAVELPPKENEEPGFLLKAEDIQPIFDGHLPAILKFFDWVSSAN